MGLSAYRLHCSLFLWLLVVSYYRVLTIEMDSHKKVLAWRLRADVGPGLGCWVGFLNPLPIHAVARFGSCQIVMATSEKEVGRFRIQTPF